MKELILDPLLLLPLMGCFSVYLFLVFLWSDTRFFQKKGVYLFSFLFFIVLCDFQIYPISLLQPLQLLNERLGPIQLLINLFYYALSAIMLRYWFREVPENIPSLFYNLFLGIFICITFLSILWSETPGHALKFTLVMFQITIFAVQIAQKYSWKEIISLLRWSSTTISILSAFYALTKPSIGVVAKGWQGVMSHPNRLGVVLGLNISLWLFHALHYPKDRALALGLAFFSLYVRQNTNSATSLIVIIILFTLLGCLKVLKTLPYRAAFAGVLFFILFASCSFFLVVENWNDFLTSLDKDPTLTGRTIVWPQMIERGMERPFLGYGSHSFWQEWRGEDNPAHGIVSDNGWVPPHAHNGFLELFLNFGFLGLIVFLCAFVVTISLSVQYMISSSVPEGLLPPMILTWMVIPNITVSSLFEPGLIWFIYVLINIRLSHDLKGKGSDQALRW